jgi:NADH:ubiquinone oxidoreductase subunit 5 (subunit L)/multisubunit Na+/H+ antiporter MnhA subunit
LPELAALLVPALPLLAALAIGATYAFAGNRGEAGERLTTRLAIGAGTLSLALLLGLDVLALTAGPPGQVVLGDWLVSGAYRVRVSFTLDALGLGLATLFALLCLLTQLFSVNYMHREPGYQRFFAVLSLFTGAILLLVTAGNAVLTFVGWELAGAASYLLIGYAFDRPVATGNALRVFVTNRVGDAGFILAIALSFHWLGAVEWPAIVAGGPGFGQLTMGLLGAGFLLAALAKSAQVPFAPWIARALEGPTPSSAIFYGAVMVHAGVYLVLRLEPLLEQAPAVMAAMALAGALTAAYGFLGGLVTADVKSALLFSTTAQVGLMFLTCGLGAFELATWHLAAHAAWRAYQFLSAPSLMHLMSRAARPVPRWLAARRTLYTATLQRFWLDQAADWLLTGPTRALARDVQAFEERVVNRLVGLPGAAGAVSSLAEWEARKLKALAAEGGVAHGRGVAGRLLQWLATGLGWVEERLVLRGGGDRVGRAMRGLGDYLLRVDELLSQPRYLILLIAATLAVIL